MKRLRIIIIALVAMMAVSAYADDVPTLKVTTDDAEQHMVLSTIKSIKYSGTDMIVYFKDDTQKTFSVNEVSMMSFDSINEQLAAIRTLTASEGPCVITDINGRLVWSSEQGMNAYEVLKGRSGMYIIKVGNESRKVIIK